MEPLEYPSSQPTPPPKRRGLFGWIAAAALIALKYGFLALKSLKTALSMLLMIWVYSWLYGWRFAAGFVALLFVHEMGHVVAAWRLGMPVSAPLFIPFVGASIVMKQSPRDAWSEALMAYGGPLAGALGSWLCWGIALQGDIPWLMAVASASFVLNLFNLIPVPPLDGGRICAAVSPWFWLVGLLLLGAAVLYFHSWGAVFIIILVLFMAAPRIRATFRDRGTPAMQAYYATHPMQRVAMAAMYILLIAMLLLGYWDSSLRLGQ
ncbi:MAG TPA: site-2 protease family protein [Candidatus Methylacidiphilales bacterium]